MASVYFRFYCCILTFRFKLATLAVVILTSLVLKLRREPAKFKHIIYLALGVITGLLARPNPLGGLKLAYIQVVQIIIVKWQNIP